MEHDESGLDLPCRLMWGAGLLSEARGVAMQLSSATALAILEFGEYVPVPPAGTAVHLEVLLTEAADAFPKCLAAEGRMEESKEVLFGRQVIACRLQKTNFKECKDPAWLARVGAIPVWTM